MPSAGQEARDRRSGPCPAVGTPVLRLPLRGHLPEGLVPPVGGPRAGGESAPPGPESVPRAASPAGERLDAGLGGPQPLVHLLAGLEHLLQLEEAALRRVELRPGAARPRVRLLELVPGRLELPARLVGSGRTARRRGRGRGRRRGRPGPGGRGSRRRRPRGPPRSARRTGAPAARSTSAMRAGSWSTDWKARRSGSYRCSWQGPPRSRTTRQVTPSSPASVRPARMEAPDEAPSARSAGSGGRSGNRSAATMRRSAAPSPATTL